MLVLFISTDYQEWNKMKGYQGWVSKSSRIGDSIHCLNFVASVPLRQWGGRGLVLTLLAVLSVTSRVTLFPIPVKCTMYWNLPVVKNYKVQTWSYNLKFIQEFRAFSRAPLSPPCPSIEVSQECDMSVAVHARRYPYSKHRDSKALLWKTSII